MIECGSIVGGCGCGNQSGWLWACVGGMVGVVRVGLGSEILRVVGVLAVMNARNNSQLVLNLKTYTYINTGKHFASTLNFVFKTFSNFY